MERMGMWSKLIMLIYGRKTFELWGEKYISSVCNIPLCYDTIIYKIRNSETTTIFRQQGLYV